MKTTAGGRSAGQDEKRRLVELAIAAAVSRMLHLEPGSPDKESCTGKGAPEPSIPG